MTASSKRRQVGRTTGLERELRAICASPEEFTRRVEAAANVAEHGSHITYAEALRRTIARLRERRGPDGKPRVLG